ncbi:Subtilisin-like protease [Morus notabilis]|uniref:Subtilisin-like protease n=1 Tax=Morus notabilis TaxID=981085 RepID=W9RTY5_9ROSA|nr:subtilisin-like protease SBT1.5 [Morus notabilis]EXB95737.1 Subtilisin-like protease [Morus notabilis]
MSLFSALVYPLIFISFSLVSSETNVDHETKTFIVRVQNNLKPSEYSNVVDWYSSTLRSLSSHTPNENDDDMIVHVYNTVFHGFSAKLTGEQAQELNQRPEILGVSPDQVRKIHTTRSPGFLGLDTASSMAISNNGLLNESDWGSNVIIGVIDSGVWPERRSFDDEGMGQIPSRWKGKCDGGESFPDTLCNKKLIGARFFNRGHEARFGKQKTEKISARDTVGHGTHTASTAAGRRVENASFFGYAQGVSSGIAPKARLAIYKVCWAAEGCLNSDIIAAVDAAVDDGVDVISISLGSSHLMPYDSDSMAIAAFGAVRNGVVFSASAGNSGPDQGTVSNAAPWITTVGASTLDRTFPADIVLGDGRVITGLSLYDGKPFPAGKYFPLIHAENASAIESLEGAGRNYVTKPFGLSGFCMPGTLDPNIVKGKIVVCNAGMYPSPAIGLMVKELGGVGVIVADMQESVGEGLVAQQYLTPGISITESARATLLNYLTSSRKPRATMRFRGTQLGVKPAPVVAFFSSRGPNLLSLDVLKPDVIAPGVDILAAWPDEIPLSYVTTDTRRSEFNIMSGTSMSCPHLSGVAALLKGAHPEWTPAVIKSAMMTTAYTHDRDLKPIKEQVNNTLATVWDMGAGHVDPVRAADPGLVYDLTEDDYIRFLCGNNYSSDQVRVITHREVNCHETEKMYPWELNYPAIAVRVNASRPSKVEISVPRTVTHISDGAAIYTVKITNPKGTVVFVSPEKMAFDKKGDRGSYVVTIFADNTSPRGRHVSSSTFSEFGMLTWTDGKRRVASPLLVTWVH